MNYYEIIIHQLLIFMHIIIKYSYSRDIRYGHQNIQKRISLYGFIHAMSIINLVAIDIQILIIDNLCFVENFNSLN